MRSRDEAVRVMEALDRAGFGYTLYGEGGPDEGRSYEVQVSLRGQDVDRLAELKGVVDVVPEAVTSVDSAGYLRVY
jgi:hypothetical protein